MGSIKEISKYILNEVKNKKMNKEEALFILKKISNEFVEKHTDIAIIGLSCQLSEANNKDEYWKNLLNGYCSIREFPDKRKKDIETLKFEVEFGGIGTFILESVEIESVENIYNDSLMTVFIFALICTAIGILGYGKNIQNRKEKLEVALALIIITVCSSYILLGNSLIWGHDINYHLNRIQGIKNALLSGQFPVRIHTGLLEGYGYASPFFYPELFLYIPALLRIMGVSLVSAVQAFCILINFMTAYFMYLAAFKISKSRYIGIISSAFYVLSIYHLCDMYTRFALGEVLAMTFIPLIIYGIYELLYGDETKWKYAVAGVTGVLQSHILTMVFTIPLILIACMICIKKLLTKKRFFSCVKAVLSCLLLNCLLYTSDAADD
ncbi:hypothetical protein CG709_18455 [Lachnotalea glycerini]|nr:hypothetical protein CG709_18455 [Lachnotalea glycerini]